MAWYEADEMDCRIKLILLAGQIPLGSIVTKITGEKRYVLKDRLRVFTEEGETRTVNCDAGTRFLVYEGDANVVSCDKELIWLATDDEARDYLDGLEV